MRRARTPQRRSGSAATRPNGGWVPLAVAAVAVSVIAGILVERLTRPAADPAGGRGGATPVAIDWPEPVTLSADEVTREGRELAERLVAEFPDLARAQTASGRLCALFGAPLEARQRWERSVALDPRQAEAWLGLAESAHADGDYPAVIDRLDRLTAVDEALARRQLPLRVESRVRMGDAPGALADLAALAPAGELPGWALVLRGEAQMQQGDHAAAAESYRLAVDDPQQASVARYGLAQCLARLGRTEEAAREREAYTRIEEENLRAFDQRQRDREAAPEDPAPRVRVLAGYHTEVGSLFAKRGRWEDAERHWRRACSLAPDMPEPRRFLESLTRR